MRFRVDDGSRLVRIHRGRHATDEERLRVRILAAQHRMDTDEILLKGERFQVVGYRHEIHFGRQRVGGVPPIAAGEEAQLAAVDHAFDALLHAAEVRRAGFFGIRNRLRQLRGLRRIGLQRRGDIDPVQSMQMIEVDDVVLHHLRARDEVAHDAGVFGNVDLQSILDGANAGDGVDHGADAADALRPDPGLARIAALQDHLDAAEHGSGTPGIGYLSSIDVGFDA